ncbi:YiiX/YebB-like N1pC/P60 family cysteine hydrolase [Ancylomarina sp. YFZ004]
MTSSTIPKFFILIFSISLLACGCHNSHKGFELQAGDLLFQDLDGSSLSDAIEEVTAEEKALSFSHVGIMVSSEKEGLVVLEAIGEAVQYTSLDSFLTRSLNIDRMPKILVGRLKKQHQSRIEKAILYGKSLVGLPYDPIYLMSDSTYYCSELIYEMFKHSGDGSEIFKLNPMTFKDAKTGRFHPVWADYYKKLGVGIPEGEPGCNPNGMSESKEIDWVFDYSK